MNNDFNNDSFIQGNSANIKLNREKMKSERVNPPYGPYSQGNPPGVTLVKLFLVMALSSPQIILPRALRECFHGG